MASSLQAGVSGLRAHQQLLDVVGNNLANINTTGFKAQRLRFSDLLSDTKMAASAGDAGRIGGTNPLQVGLGVRTASIDTDLKQGSLEATGNNLDLAIQGDGYFVVRLGAKDSYTRAGAFSVDADNTLVDSATGYRVQRYGTVGEANSTTAAFQVPSDTAVKIPFGTSIPGKATDTVTIKGNLSASSVGPLAETLTSNQSLTAASAPATAATQLNALDSNTIDYLDGDKILISGTDTTGSAVSATFTYGAGNDGTTLGDLLIAINSAYSQATATLDAAGNIVFKAISTGPAKLTLTIADDSANVGATTFSDHNMILTVDGKDGDTVKTSIQVFDIQGTPHNLTITFQKQSDNLWDLTAAVDPTEGVTIDANVDTILFNDDGSFRQAGGVGNGDTDISFQINGLSSPQLVSFSFGSANGFDGLTQYGGPTSAAATEQDGFTAGFLTDISVATSGILNGIFTNGRILPIAQLAIASFTNPGGLERLGDNYFGLSGNSGLALLGTALAGGRGSIQNGALESSNVDVALEFTRLITAQRGFQVNARVITTTDEVLQELSNIKR